MYIRVFIIILLTAVFLKYFGLKSFQKFKSGGVMIDRKHKYSTTIEAPVIVCVLESHKRRPDGRETFPYKIYTIFAEMLRPQRI